MTHVSRVRSLTNGLGLEIERLIRQLPGADPMLKGDVTPRAATAVTDSIGLAAPPRRPSLPVANPARPPARDRRLELAGAWLRTVAAAVLGTAVIFWPYAHSCGWLLHTYLGVIAAVLVTGGWASMTAWRLRVAAAHVLSLVVVFWGIVLAAEQILPRIGYAATQAIWTCGR